MGKGLGELARTDQARFGVEFVEALPQAQQDLESIEKVLNEVWEMALRELNDFKGKYAQEAYEKAQRPTKKEKLPSWWTPPPSRPVSSAAAIGSGSVTT